MTKGAHVSEPPATKFLREHGIAFTEPGYDYVEHGGTADSSKQLGVPEHEVSQTLVMLAEKLCAGKVVFLLEGGYHLKGLQESALQSLDALTGQRKQPALWKPDITFETVLEKSRKTLGSYWKF